MSDEAATLFNQEQKSTEQPAADRQQETSPNPSEETKQQEEQSTQQPNPDTLFADQLSSIKAEDGRQKYADVSTALQSIPHAQETIKQLKEELASTKEQLEQAKRVEDMLDQLEQSKQQVSGDTQQPSQGLTQSDIEQLLEAKLQEKQQLSVMESNKQKVAGALTEKFGDKAEEVFNTRASELGVRPEELTQLALQHPQLVLGHFEGVTVNGKGDANVTSTVNTTGTRPVQAERKPVAYGASSKDVLESFRNHAV